MRLRAWRENTQAYEHGDNFVIKGLSANSTRSSLVTFGPRSKGVHGRRSSKGDVSEIDCMHRICRWSVPSGNRPEAVEIEADARHIDIILNQLTLVNAQTVVTPGIKTDSPDRGARLPPD